MAKTKKDKGGQLKAQDLPLLYGITLDTGRSAVELGYILSILQARGDGEMVALVSSIRSNVASAKEQTETLIRHLNDRERKAAKRAAKE